MIEIATPANRTNVAGRPLLVGLTILVAGIGVGVLIYWLWTAEERTIARIHKHGAIVEHIKGDFDPYYKISGRFVAEEINRLRDVRELEAVGNAVTDENFRGLTNFAGLRFVRRLACARDGRDFRSSWKCTRIAKP